MRRAAWCAWGILLGSVVGSATAVAQSPRTPEIDRAQQQIENGDFEEAVKTVEAGLSEQDLSDDQLAELYRELGLAELYLGNEDKAKDAYEKLLQARPDFQLPDNAPPKIKKLYARILEDIRKRRVRPVTLEVAPLPDARGDEPLIVPAHVTDVPLGARVRLHFRRAGAQSFSSVDFQRDRGRPGFFNAVVPAYELPAESRPYEIDYYVEVADVAQRRLAGRGDAYTPLVFKVLGHGTQTAAVEQEKPWYTNPVVWIVGGVVVAGGAATAIYFATAKQTATLTITLHPQ